MRIALAHSFYRLSGGEDSYVRRLHALLAAEHEVLLVAESNASLDPDLRTAARMLHSPSRRRSLAGDLRRFSPDVVHVHNPYPALGPAVHQAAEDAAVPLVMTVHNLRLRCPNGVMFTEGEVCRRCERGQYANAVAHRCFPSRRQAAAYAAALWTHRFIFRLERRIARFIAPSEFMRRRLGEWGIPAEVTSLVRPGIAPRGAGEPGGYGLYLGRLSVEKGLDVLVDALAAAGDPPFVIAGEGPMEPLLKARTERHGLRRLEFRGWLSEPERDRVLAGCSFLVMPSRCEENAPMAVLEALSQAKAVVVAAIGGLPELAADGRGLTFAAGDADALADVLRRLQEDSGLADRLGAAGQRFASTELSQEGHLERLEAAYDTARR